MGYIFVTRNDGVLWCLRWMCWLHFSNPRVHGAVFGGGDKVFCVFNVLREVCVSMAFRYLSGRVFCGVGCIMRLGFLAFILDFLCSAYHYLSKFPEFHLFTNHYPFLLLHPHSTIIFQ